MDIWTAIVAIVSMGLLAEIIKYSIKTKHKDGGNHTSCQERMDQMERRIESLESIVIDLEKDQKYRNLN